ncbi:hypothetical protein O0L34_g19077 [Tuta absoluta]|nr:hypothetical protein O0L34_g19077 [Tuta absoluta]
MSSAGPSTSQGVQRNYEIIDNRNKGKTLLHVGYRYVHHRTNKFSSVWVCVNKRHGKCSGSVKLDNKVDNVQMQMRHADTCLPDGFKNKVKVVMDQIKKEVETNFDSVKKIFESRTAALKNQGYDAEIPAYKDVKTGLFNHRNKALKVPKTKFKNPSDVIIPDKFKKHVLIDFNHNGNRIIVFASPKAKTEIKKVRDYFCDGTFDCCPLPFTQIFTIHGDVSPEDTTDDTNVVPMVYVLLANKEKETYKTMFTKIKEALPDFNPEKFILDFEISTILAINDVFPQANIHGCYVHFQRAVYRKATSLGLMDHEETALHVKLCTTLPFLPEEDIDDGWLAIMENSQPDEKVTNFNNYFVTQWLEPEGMKEKWCCYNERHRTTNLVEAWNQRLQMFLGARPSLLSFYEMVELDISTYDTAQER